MNLIVMKRFFPLVMLCFCTLAKAGSDLLVTPAEMEASDNSPISFTAKAAPVKDAPTILLLSPKLPGNVSSPTPIELKFQAVAASVKPETFKAFYGAFEIDITKKLLGLAKVTDVGIYVPEAALPKGKHKILLVVEDSAGRSGGRLIEFEVN